MLRRHRTQVIARGLGAEHPPEPVELQEELRRGADRIESGVMREQGSTAIGGGRVMSHQDVMQCARGVLQDRTVIPAFLGMAETHLVAGGEEDDLRRVGHELLPAALDYENAPPDE